mmetsp:Transcript_106580/g.306582  ORF Transcript_106580/g.306582 Transcript_106580/m.306582 type:complete len:228 (-) Transcript_106580:184-867(-)
MTRAKLATGAAARTGASCTHHGVSPRRHLRRHGAVAAGAAQHARGAHRGPHKAARRRRWGEPRRAPRRLGKHFAQPPHTGGQALPQGAGSGPSRRGQAGSMARGMVAAGRACAAGAPQQEHGRLLLCLVNLDPGDLPVRRRRRSPRRAADRRAAEANLPPWRRTPGGGRRKCPAIKRRQPGVEDVARGLHSPGTVGEQSRDRTKHHRSCCQGSYGGGESRTAPARLG